MPPLRTPALRSPVRLRPGPLRTRLCSLDAPQPWSSLWASSASPPRASVQYAPLGRSLNSHLPDDPLRTSLRSPPDDLRHLRTALTLNLIPTGIPLASLRTGSCSATATMVQYRYIYAGCMSGEYIRSGIHPGMPRNTRTSLQHPSELPGPPPAQGQVAHFDIQPLYSISVLCFNLPNLDMSLDMEPY
jgi:hypothetical protein